MKKRYAIITDIHGNLEGLEAILSDIKGRNVNDIFCLGDIVSIGPSSKECIDKIMQLDIKTVLGDYELYLLKGCSINTSIRKDEKKYFDWVRSTLDDKEISFLKKCPLYYTINIDYDNKISSKEIVLCHYLIDNINNGYPFEHNNLRNDINLWIKYNNPNRIYIIGHLHDYFDVNEVEGILDDSIISIDELPNIEVVGSGGCSYDEYVSYMIIEIDKSIRFDRINVKFDRKKFISKIRDIDYPEKKILKYYYGVKNDKEI